MQNAERATYGCSTIFPACSSWGAVAAIDDAPRYEAEIWVSLHRAGGNLCCGGCTLNTNATNWIVSWFIGLMLSLFPGSWSCLCFGWKVMDPFWNVIRAFHRNYIYWVYLVFHARWVFYDLCLIMVGGNRPLVLDKGCRTILVTINGAAEVLSRWILSRRQRLQMTLPTLIDLGSGRWIFF